MQHLKFREILLVSEKEQKGRSVGFHPELTVIRGNNETGKSTLLKSLLWAFGTEPEKWHPKWQGADPTVLVHFDLDDVSYSVLRKGRIVAFFDGKGTVLKVCTSVTTEVAPFWGGLVNFDLALPGRKGKPMPLPPAYFFLPFYMDQDASWTRQWQPFSYLGQFPDWKRSVIDYHTGTRGKDYYQAKAKKDELHPVVADLKIRGASMRKVHDTLQERLEATHFDIDTAAYQEEISRLLDECNALKETQEKYKATLLELRNKRTALLMQIAIARSATNEAREDYNIISELPEEVECPTCGQHYDNSFAERFEIASDEHRCQDIVARLTGELAEVDGQIAKSDSALAPVASRLARISELMAVRKGQLQVRDLLLQQGRAEVRQVILNDATETENQISALLYQQDQLQEKMDRTDNPDRRKQVNAQFRVVCERNLASLNVSSPVPGNVYATVKASGSVLPRSLLAYQYAMAEVIGEFGFSTFAPMVVDSPKQQDPDPRNARRIVQFLAANRPHGCQVILGMVGTEGEQLHGKEEVLSRKFSLLEQDKYKTVAERLRPFLDAMLRHAPRR